MSINIQKICVIGAGQMGASIAAHMANGGFDVLLLDMEKSIADKAVQKLMKAKPAAFMDKRFASNIMTGSSQTDMALINDCDWILEAATERLDIKKAIFTSIDEHRKAGSIISSNTSTLQREQLVEGMGEDFKKDFFITHFFNPPRYMRLLELVGGSESDLENQAALKSICDERLGKTVIECFDKPGFIANRLGIFWLYTALAKTLEHGKTVEEADKLLSKPFGIPKTGVFGLMDLVGIDLMPYVTHCLVQALPKTDAFVQTFKPIKLVEEMIKDGYVGRKGRGGFYRLNGKTKQVRNLDTGEYIDAVRPKKEKRPAKMLMASDAFVQDVMGATLRYAHHLIGDATDQVWAIDEAMKQGYNWKKGPFELIAEIGEENLGITVPDCGLRQPARTGVLNLSDIKGTQKPLLKNPSAKLWDLGDGVVCFEFTSQMNMLDHLTMELMEKSIQLCGQNHKAMVLYNGGENFSIGANLGLALFQANIAGWETIQELVDSGQKIMQALKYAPFPVIGAPQGMALGGGCEFLLHCDQVVAHAETYAGLVETGVGLIPAWGGLKEMMGRWQSNRTSPNGPIPASQKTFETVGMAQVATSAHEAIKFGFFKADTKIIMNKDRLLFEAKKTALECATGYKPVKPYTYHLAGPSGKCAFDLAVQSFRDQGKALKHDQQVMGHLGSVLSGGPTGDMTVELNENDILALEQKEFMKLVQHPATIDRIEHMVLHHKPLRN